MTARTLDSIPAGETLATAAHAGRWTLRTNDGPVSADGRSELLARLARGELVELFLDAVTYSQAPGVANRNFVRFDPERLMDIAATGLSNPFLRDHAQHSMEAVGGVIVASEAKANGAAIEFLQTMRLTEPWAVRAAIVETLRGFSIGWINLPVKGKLTAEVTCSVCSRSVRDCAWELGHFRGVEVAGQIVEWIIGNAELIETSGVPVPAVREVRPLGIREELSPAALAAELRTFGLAVQVPAAIKQQENDVDLSKIAAALGLEPSATEETIIAAVRKRESDSTQLKADVVALKAEQDAAAAREGTLAAATADVKARVWADALVAEGKLAPQGKLYEHLIGVHVANAAEAAELAAALPVVTPVGRQSQADRKTSNKLTLSDLVAQLSAEDMDACRQAARKLSTSKRPMTPEAYAETYIKTNYAELATSYGWPKEMP